MDEVAKRYDNWAGRDGTVALDRTSLTVKTGEFLCVLGPSGCGKSTMLNLVAGFVRPTQGQVTIEGRPITGPGPDRGVVFQDPALFPWLNVRQNVELGLQAAGRPAAERQKLADRWLRMTGLSAAHNEMPAALSGGMRQRVALARVLVLEPSALLLDEPFTALDGPTREHLQDELLDLWQARSQTVMFVTHNVSEAAYLADRVAIMSAAPNTVAHVVNIQCPRPRRRGGEELMHITKQLRRAAEEAAGPPEDRSESLAAN
jgi:NitT/TauT family transport system ATP-binding protein